MKLVPVLLPYCLALAAASFLYVAMADLIPGLHRGRTDAHSLRQILLIAAGVATAFRLRPVSAGSSVRPRVTIGGTLLEKRLSSSASRWQSLCRQSTGGLARRTVSCLPERPDVYYNAAARHTVSCLQPPTVRRPTEALSSWRK